MKTKKTHEIATNQNYRDRPTSVVVERHPHCTEIVYQDGLANGKERTTQVKLYTPEDTRYE